MIVFSSVAGTHDQLQTLNHIHINNVIKITIIIVLQANKLVSKQASKQAGKQVINPQILEFTFTYLFCDTQQLNLSVTCTRQCRYGTSDVDDDDHFNFLLFILLVLYN